MINNSNSTVLEEVGLDGPIAFRFFLTSTTEITNVASLFNTALTATEAIADGKETWVTETGWPYVGPKTGAATSTMNDAGHYWQEVGCPWFGQRNIFWYTLQYANPSNKVKFAITNDLSSILRFNTPCLAERGERPPPTSIRNQTSSSNVSGASNRLAGL